MMSVANTVMYDVPAQRWKALKTRDPLANSAFFYGVASTKVFCRPTCPARLARHNNIVFFDDTSSAQNAGFRACKRCDPCNPQWHRELKSRMDFENVRQMIAAAVLENEYWSVGGVAKKAGISLGHMHRLFKKYANATPKQFANASASASGIAVPQAPVYLPWGELQHFDVDDFGGALSMPQEACAERMQDWEISCLSHNHVGAHENLIFPDWVNTSDFEMSSWRATLEDFVPSEQFAVEVGSSQVAMAQTIHSTGELGTTTNYTDGVLLY